MTFPNIGRYIVTSICLLKLGIVQSSSADISGRIVGGIPTNVSSICYIVQLWADGFFICGGSLARKNFVITAAHCADDVNAHQLSVIGGSTYLNEPGVKRKVKKIMIHPNYNSNTLANDLCVLLLSSPMAGPNICVIPLNRDPLKANSIVKVSGWGVTHETSMIPSNQLRTIKAPILAYAKCCDLYKGVAKITNTMFCASTPNFDKDACWGDSGGPAECNKRKLCGVVSWGIGCAQKNKPGVYTKIKSLISFIDKCINQA